jgi:hypothetical protein
MEDWLLTGGKRKVIFPENYRIVGIAREERPKDPIYFSTQYLISYGEEIAIFRVKSSGKGFMHKVEALEPIARGREIIEYPEKIETRDRTKLIEIAYELCKNGVNTVIFNGFDEHINFVHQPDLDAVIEIEILDVVPPDPSWLVYVIEGLERCGALGDLTVKFSKRILDLRKFEGENVYYPCTASGLGKSLDTDRVEIDNPCIIGCEVSREIFTAMYPEKEFQFLSTCPLKNKELEPHGPFITRCCRSEMMGITTTKAHTGVIVHWGDGPPEIAEAIRSLTEELRSVSQEIQVA